MLWLATLLTAPAAAAPLDSVLEVTVADATDAQAPWGLYELEVTVTCRDWPPSPLPLIFAFEHTVALDKGAAHDAPFSAEVWPFDVKKEVTFDRLDCVRSATQRYTVNVTIDRPIFAPGLVPLSLRFDLQEDARRANASLAWEVVSPLHGSVTIFESNGWEELTLDIQNAYNVALEGNISRDPATADGIDFDAVPVGPIARSFQDGDSVGLMIPVRIDAALRDLPYDTYPVVLDVRLWPQGSDGTPLYAEAVEMFVYLDESDLRESNEAPEAGSAHFAVVAIVVLALLARRRRD